jgi:KaiC/GvpD/RAD55 family RecA-like ATPase
MLEYSFLGFDFLDSLLGLTIKSFLLNDDILSILISGKPGTGKSTLCTQMAKCFTENILVKNIQRGVIYYSTEEPLRNIERRISNIDSYDKDRIQRVYRSQNGDSIFDKLKEQEIDRIRFCKRLALRFEIPLDDLVKTLYSNQKASICTEHELIESKRIADFALTLRKDVLEIENKFHWQEYLIILDNISNLFENSIGDIPRSFVRALYDCKYNLKDRKNDNKYIFVFISELSDQRALAEHLSDVHIHLTAEENKDHFIRTLTVKKARNMPVPPIQHNMVMNNTGIHLIPRNIKWNIIPDSSDFSTISASDTKWLKFGLNDSEKLNNYLNLPRKKDRNGLRPGTATLIYGTHETRKTILSIYFIIGNDFKDYKSSKLLSFINNDRASSDLCNLIIDNFNNLTKKDNHHSGFNFAKDIIIPCSDHLKSITDFEYEIYKHTLLNTDRPSKLVVIDLCQIYLRYNENEIINSLSSIIKNLNYADITSVFTYTTSDDQDVLHAKHLQMLFDNVLKTIIIGNAVGLPNEVAIKIEKYDNTNIIAPLVHCAYNPHDGSLTASDTILNTAFEDTDGTLHYGDVTIYYYPSESEQLEKHYEFLKKTFESMIGIEKKIDKWEVEKIGSNILPAGGVQLQRFLHGANLIRQKKTEVMMIDEQWLPGLKPHLLPLNDLIKDNLKELKDQYTINFKELVGTYKKRNVKEYSFLSHCIQKEKTEETVFALPYYANMTLLVHNKDLIARYINECPEGNILPNIKNIFDLKGNANPNFIEIGWNEIFEISQAVANFFRCKDPKEENNKIVPFYYSKTSEECCSCFLLSLLWDEIKKNTNNNNEYIFPDLKEEQIEDSIIAWVKKGKDCGIFLNPRKNIEKNYEPENKINNINFVFAHLWHSTYLDLICNQGTMKFQASPIPSIKGKIKEGISISGNWYLGILKGSHNPALANELIQQILSSYALDLLFHRNGAIPAKKEYWTKSSATQTETLHLLMNVQSRNSVLNYTKYSRELSTLFTEIVDLSNNNDIGPLKDRVKPLLSQLNDRMNLLLSLPNSN